MTLSTNPRTGDLNPIENCELIIPNAGTITLNNLPEISDSKSAVYNNEAIMGRSFPLYTYHYSNDRSINIQFHFFVTKKEDATENLNDLRKIQSAVYPREGEEGGAPFKPPVICKFECRQLLADGPLCMVLQQYSVKFPTDVAWDEETYCPYRFDVDTNWLVVYTSDRLPNQDQIIKSGR